MGKFPIPVSKFLFEKKGVSECSLSLLARNKKTKRDCFAIARNDNKVSCYCEPAKGERGNPVLGAPKSLSLRGFPQGKPWQSQKRLLSRFAPRNDREVEIATP